MGNWASLHKRWKSKKSKCWSLQKWKLFYSLTCSVDTSIFNCCCQRGLATEFKTSHQTSQFYVYENSGEKLNLGCHRSKEANYTTPLLVTRRRLDPMDASLCQATHRKTGAFATAVCLQKSWILFKKQNNHWMTKRDNNAIILLLANSMSNCRYWFCFERWWHSILNLQSFFKKNICGVWVACKMHSSQAISNLLY